MFVVFIHVKGDLLDNELKLVIESLKARHGAPFSPILDKLQVRSHQLIFHETYHFWQGLRLPFLHRYAMLSFRNAFLAFKELSKTGEVFSNWSCILPEFERLRLPSQVGCNSNGKLFFGANLEDTPGQISHHIELTPLAMLECAASIAEFQITTSTGLSDPEVFRRWTKRNAAYLDPFDFAAKFLGDEALALRTLLPLINASFHTSIPERAFVELLARLWGRFVVPNDYSRMFLDQPEPCRWPEVFQLWLDELSYDTPDNVTQILEPSFYRIALEEWVFGGFGNKGALIHPFLGPLARLWRNREKENPEFSWVLDQPGWMSNEVFSQCRREFLPPVSVFKFHLGNDRDRVFIHGNMTAPSFLEYMGVVDNTEFKGFIADSLSMYGAIRRASGAHFDADQRTCHHNVCPHFESNFCNMYPVIPDNFQDCGFPARLERLINQWR